jgi:hypothetical protein
MSDPTSVTLDLGGWTAQEMATSFHEAFAPKPTINSTFGHDTARTRRTDPRESHLAADSNNVRDSRAVVLAAFHERLNFADHELVEHLVSSGYTPQRIRTARHELAEDDLLEVAGTTQTPSGRQCRVWTLRKDAA